METSNATNNESDRNFAFTHIAKGLADLFDCILADAVTDIEVASRDLQISDASFVRLRRALDRVACAQSVLETMRVGTAEMSDDETAECAGAGKRQMGMRQLAIRDVGELMLGFLERTSLHPIKLLTLAR
jgi:hypothetical protein